jgi:hypothetical protein
MSVRAETKSPFSRWRDIAPSAWTGLAGLMFIALLTSGKIRVPPMSLTSFLGQLIIASLFSTFAHEAGHAIAAVCVGFKISSFAVWPVCLLRTSAGWQIRRMRKLRLAGFITVDPVTPDNLRTKFATTVAAGPLASLVTGMSAALIVASTKTPDSVTTQLSLIAFISLLGTVLVFLPTSRRTCVSDGQRLRMLLQRREASDRFCALLLLGSASRNGVRPRDLNQGLIDLLPGPFDGSLDYWGAQLIRYNWLIDTGRTEDAGITLMSLLNEALPAEIKQSLQLQAAWFEARFRGDLEMARRWMAAAPIDDRPDAGYRCTLARARAAIAFLLGRWDEAEEAAADALRQCDRIVDLGATMVIREGIIKLQTDIASAKQGLRAGSQV